DVLPLPWHGQVVARADDRGFVRAPAGREIEAHRHRDGDRDAIREQAPTPHTHGDAWLQATCSSCPTSILAGLPLLPVAPRASHLGADDINRLRRCGVQTSLDAPA